jgi:hypothetical protein
MPAVLIPALAQLRRELDYLAPERDRRSDGWIGDPAHRDRVSDHNPDESGRVPIRDADVVDEVHALDVDADLNVPGLTMTRVVNAIVGRCRDGAEKRLRYVIWNRLIWHVDNGWEPADYGGTNPHTAHAHFSASYDTAREASTASWRLEDIPVAMTPQDKTFVAETIRKEVTAQLGALEARLLAHMPARVWNHTEENPEDIDPATGKPRQGRMGGWVRMANKRANDRHDQVMQALIDIDEAITSADGATPPAPAS